MSQCNCADAFEIILARTGIAIVRQSLPLFFSIAFYKCIYPSTKNQTVKIFHSSIKPSNSQLVVSEHTRKYTSECEGQIFILNLEKEDTIAVCVLQNELYFYVSKE